MEKNDLIKQYIALVKNIAGKYRNSKVSFDDLIQEGLLGLLEARTRYDPSRKIKFDTYAYSWINKRIREFIRRENKKEFVELNEDIIKNVCEKEPDNTQIILPDSLNEIEKDVLRYFFKENMPLDKIAKLLGLRRERVRQIKQKALRKIRINTKLI